MSLKWRFIIAPLLGLILISLLIFAYFQQLVQLNKELESIVDQEMHTAQIVTSIANQSAVNNTSIFNLLRMAEFEEDEGLVYDQGKGLLLNIHDLETLVLSDAVSDIFNQQLIVEPKVFFERFTAYKHGATNAIILATVDLKLAKQKMLELMVVFNHLNVDLIFIVGFIESKIKSSLKSHRSRSEDITQIFFVSVASTLLVIMFLSVLLSVLFSKKLKLSIELLHSLTVVKEKDKSAKPVSNNELNILNEVIQQVKVNHENLIDSKNTLKNYQRDLEDVILERTKELEGSSRELLKSKRHAEDRAAQVEIKNNKLNDAIGQLKEAQKILVESEKNAALGRLVAGVAHEVNTPLGMTVTAVSYLEELTKKIQASFDKKTLSISEMSKFLNETKESISIANINSQRAAVIINNFKQIASDQTAFDYHDVDLHSYLDQVVKSVTPEFKKRPIFIENICDSDIRIFTLPGALAQIITNLIMNSLIHAYDQEQEGIIKISAKRKNDRVFIYYEDDGKGISKENIVKMYEPFFTTNRSGGGTGLGMHIVFNLITNALQGTIACHSEIGLGTRFEIDIPLVYDVNSLNNSI